MDIPSARLFNQHLTNNKFNNVQEVVDYFGAVQAQDFSAAKWSLGIRLKNSTNTDIEKAYNAGKILRTHIMRPTWHFITPKNLICSFKPPVLNSFKPKDMKLLKNLNPSI